MNEAPKDVQEKEAREEKKRVESAPFLL